MQLCQPLCDKLMCGQDTPILRVGPDLLAELVGADRQRAEQAYRQLHQARGDR